MDLIIYFQNYYLFVLILNLTIVWLVFKIFKADMGFRCKSVPCFSWLVSAIMVIIRFTAFLFGVFVLVFGVGVHFWTTIKVMIHTYISSSTPIGP